MLVEITAVSDRDAFSVDRVDVIGSVFEVHPTDVIEWSDGWFGIAKAKLVKGATPRAETLFVGSTPFHEVKFDVVP